MGRPMLPHPGYLLYPFSPLLVEASKIKGLQFFPGDEVSFHVLNTALDLTLGGVVVDPTYYTSRVPWSARPVGTHYEPVVTGKPGLATPASAPPP